jgi:hypothetical protein
MGELHKRVSDHAGAIEDIFSEVAEHNREMATFVIRLRAEYIVWKSVLNEGQQRRFERILSGLEFTLGEQFDADDKCDWRGFRHDFAELCLAAAEADEAFNRKQEHPINDPTVRAQVWGLTGGKCAYCQIALAPDGCGNGETHTYCVEHVVPVSYGGPNNIRNYVPSCRSCNNSKSDKHVLTFIRNNLPARMDRADIRLVANGLPERMT